MQYLFQGLITIAGVFIAFWIKDVFWENRKRKADFEQKRLADCLCPLHAELLAMPDLFSSNFVRDRILPIVGKNGFLLADEAYEAFAEMCFAETEYRRVHEQMDAIGRIDKRTFHRLSTIITAAMPMEEMVKHLSAEDVEALRTSAQVDKLFPELQSTAMNFCDKALGFSTVVRSEYLVGLANYHARSGQVPYDVPLPKALQLVVDRIKRQLPVGQRSKPVVTNISSGSPDREG